jgi:hypothetical protein
MSLTSDYQARKAIPICTGCFDYFPDALAAVASCRSIANEKHNPGKPLHWSTAQKRRSRRLLGAPSR